MNIKTYLKSARKLVESKGNCNDRRFQYVYCINCFYRKDMEADYRDRPHHHYCGGVMNVEKHFIDAKAFIAKYTTPVYIELEEK